MASLHHRYSSNSNNRAVAWVLVIGVLPSSLVPIIHLVYTTGDSEFFLAFTRLMQWDGGLGSIAVGLILIVDITLALMGLVFARPAALGKPIRHTKLLHLQPLLYGGGQLLHISAQGLEGLYAKLLMAAMGIGGVLAIMGGVLFVWIMLTAPLANTRSSGDTRI